MMPAGFHYGMRFMVKKGAFTGTVGTIAATDFKHESTDLWMPDGTLLTFQNHELDLYGHENCDAPVCVRER
jgi:hypothetical protein